MAIDQEDAQRIALETAVDSYRQSIDVVPVDLLPFVYESNPLGWMLFAVIKRDSFQLGGTEYVAVHPETGEVRGLGVIGE